MTKENLFRGNSDNPFFLCQHKVLICFAVVTRVCSTPPSVSVSVSEIKQGGKYRLLDVSVFRMTGFIY